MFPYSCAKCGQNWESGGLCACSRETAASNSRDRNRSLNRREQVALAWILDEWRCQRSTASDDELVSAFNFADRFCGIADETEAK